jgi:hypothetical protein
MPFDGAKIISPAVSRFLADHNLSAHRRLTRMSIAELHTWYDAVAYRPVNSSDAKNDHSIEAVVVATDVRTGHEPDLFDIFTRGMP